MPVQLNCWMKISEISEILLAAKFIQAYRIGHLQS